MQVNTEEERISKWYQFALNNYYDYVMAATNVSYNLAGRKVEPRILWATVIFTKFCTTSYSILQLLPNNKISIQKISHWDFPSVASLGRNLIECYHALFYLCFDKITEEEYQCRKELFNLHDCISRKKMFSDFGSYNTDDFDKPANMLRERLKVNPVFLSFSEKRQKHLLKGDDAFYLIKDEIEERIGDKVLDYKAMYKFFSNQAHSFPMSFYRMTEHKKRGTGVENIVDKGYIATTLEYISQYLQDATKRMVELFPDVVNVVDNKIIEALNKPFEHFSERSMNG